LNYQPQNIAVIRSYLTSLCFLLALLLLPVPVSYAAELNITQNQLPVNLGPYLDYFEDPEHAYTIEQMTSDSIQWQRSTQTIPTMGMSESAHWFSIVLSGENMLGEDLVLALDTVILDRVEFYFVDGGTVVRTSVAGDTVPLSQLDYPYRFPIVPLEIPGEGQHTKIIFRAVSSVGVEIPLTLTTVSLLAESQQSVLVFDGALLVMFLFCFGITVIVFSYTRDPLFLGVSFFFGAGTVFVLTQTGLGRIWFWPESIGSNTRLSLISAIGMMTSLCLIGRVLQFESRYRDSINIVLRFVSYSMIPLVLYYLIIPFDQISSNNVIPLMVIGLLVVLAVLIMASIAAIQGSKAAIYLVTSWVLIIFAYISLLGFKFEIIERTASSAIIAEALSIAAVVFLLMAMGEFVHSKNHELENARMETKAKGDFLKNVSREFLTPVHLILANSKRLMATHSDGLDDLTRRHMTTVIVQSEHLHKLINDLLEMAELESDSFEPEYELIEISNFLDDIKKIMSTSIMEKGLQLETKFASANLLVQSDRLRLQHILINIITNATKFTEKGSILLAYKAIYFQRRLGIEISIEDTGRGMSEEFQQVLFREFSREDGDNVKDPQGTGLGLVIVKRMVEKLGGELTFESRNNEGSRFHIRLPLRVIKD
jgi:signal transduction histidine kinase|tara:strand:+ start:3214 stop:5172 length:1959 start_codon:yes stop_codon:yes gene_type:complete